MTETTGLWVKLRFKSGARLEATLAPADRRQRKLLSEAPAARLRSDRVSGSHLPETRAYTPFSDFGSSVVGAQTVAAIYRSAVERSETTAAQVPDRVERFGRITLEHACESMAIFDTPDGCVERLQRVRDGFNIGRLICWFNIGGMLPHAQVMRSIEMFAARVMPHM